MEYYKEFLNRGGHGIFAVSLSGRYSAYVYCPGDRCMNETSFASKAIGMCEKNGNKCVLFYSGGEIIVPYDVVP